MTIDLSGISDFGEFAEALEMEKRVKELRSSFKSIDGREVLSHYNPQNSFEKLGHEGTTEIVHSCLIERVLPHHTNKDENPSASFNVDTLKYHCWSFGGGDFIWLIQTLEEDNPKRVMSVLSSIVLRSRDTSPDDLLKEIESFFLKEERVLSTPTYDSSILKPWSLLHPYLYEDRGFSQQTLTKFKAGYDEKERRIVIPHFVKGKLVGWQKRRMDLPQYPQTPFPAPKYQNSPGFPKESTLYNWDEATISDQAIVVEAPMAVWRIDQARVFDPSLGPGVSTFGATSTREQRDQLGKLSKVTIWLDPDLPGVTNMFKLANSLMYKTRVEVVVSSMLGDQDPADYTPQEVAQLAKVTRPASLLLPELEKQLKSSKKISKSN